MFFLAGESRMSLNFSLFFIPPQGLSLQVSSSLAPLYARSASPLSLLYAPSPPQSSARGPFPPPLLVEGSDMMATLKTTPTYAGKPCVLLLI